MYGNGWAISVGALGHSMSVSKSLGLEHLNVGLGASRTEKAMSKPEVLDELDIQCLLKCWERGLNCIRLRITCILSLSCALYMTHIPSHDQIMHQSFHKYIHYQHFHPWSNAISSHAIAGIKTNVNSYFHSSYAEHPGKSDSQQTAHCNHGSWYSDIRCVILCGWYRCRRACRCW